jgi:hypothetical protein
VLQANVPQLVEENGSKLTTITQLPRDFVYHVKFGLRIIFGIHVKDQILQVKDVQQHNGRRLSYYKDILAPGQLRNIYVKLIDFGPHRNPNEVAVQLMVRTLTG